MTFRQMIEGLEILARYEKNGLDADLNGADHDVIWAATAEVGDLGDVDVDSYLDKHGEYPPMDDTRLSPTTNARLRELGWHISPEYGDAWTHYC